LAETLLRFGGCGQDEANGSGTKNRLYFTNAFANTLFRCNGTEAYPLTNVRETAENFRLDGKVAVVTGGGSGIGQAIALRFAANGATVRIVDVNLRQAEETVKRVLDNGGAASGHACDVADQAQVQETFQQIFAKEKVSILVNNAGVSHIGTVESTTEEDFNRVFRVNVKGIYNGIHACIGHMKENGGGVILNMASIAGSAALADRFAYSMSKGAAVAMTYSVAKDYISYNIRCNCISPARVHTPFVDDYLKKNYPGREKEMYERLAKSQPIGRMGKPEEVAALALFLCSDEASFVTGVDYPLDGGFFNLRG
jgi:2-keto-3-deoxy-L-fuconate dehydrogenase